MRPPAEIDADVNLSPPTSGETSVWEAWCNRLAPGEHDDLMVWHWMTGIVAASSGLIVPAHIADDPRLSSPARVVLAVLETAENAAAVDCVAFATARIFGHEHSDFARIVRLALAELEDVGVLSRTRTGGCVL